LSIENFYQSMGCRGLFRGLEGFKSRAREYVMNVQNVPRGANGSGADQGRRRPRRTPKGRQVDLKALDEVRALLGERERRRDLLIEHRT
jgi:hypothetical protein